MQVCCRFSTDDSEDEPIAAATAYNIEPLNIAEDEEISLDGFGSESITSTSIDEQEDEEDDKGSNYRRCK